jgi:hypothetical protein
MAALESNPLSAMTENWLHAEVLSPKTILFLAMLDLFCQHICSTSLIALSLSGLAISVYVTAATHGSNL